MRAEFINRLEKLEPYNDIDYSYFTEEKLIERWVYIKNHNPIKRYTKKFVKDATKEVKQFNEKCYSSYHHFIGLRQGCMWQILNNEKILNNRLIPKIDDACFGGVHHCNGIYYLRINHSIEVDRRSRLEWVVFTMTDEETKLTKKVHVYDSVNYTIFDKYHNLMKQESEKYLEIANKNYQQYYDSIVERNKHLIKSIFEC
jgi:hypothetical protein